MKHFFNSLHFVISKKYNSDNWDNIGRVNAFFPKKHRIENHEYPH